MLKWILTYCFCIAVIGCFAQNHSYRQYTTDDGLPTNYVYGVIEDDDGYIWAYTENGLARFDGQSFRNYTTDDGLPSNDVHYLLKDTFGTIWIQSSVGTAAYIEGDSIVSLDFKRNQLVAALHLGLPRYNNGWNQYIFDKNKSIDSILIPPRLAESLPPLIELCGYFFKNKNKSEYQGFYADGSIFFEYKDGRLKKHPIQYEILNKEFNYCITNSFTTTVDAEGVFFIKDKTKEQLYYQWKDLLGTTPKKPSFPQNFNAKGDIFIVGTNEGFGLFDADLQALQVFIPHYIRDNYTLHRLFIDSQDNYWLSTREGGLFFINREELKTSLIQAKDGRDQLIERLITRAGEIYAITDNMNIYQLENNTLRRIYTHPLQVNFNAAIALPNKDILLANARQPLILDNQSNKVVKLEDYPNLKDISCSYLNTVFSSKDLENVKQVGFNEYTQQLFFTHNSIIYGTSSYHLPSKKTRYINKETSQIIYIDTFTHQNYFVQNNKLLSYEKEALQTQIDSLDGISVLYAKDKQRLWIGTQNKGLYEWNRQADTLAKISNRKYIRRIYKEENSYYLASNEGLIKLEEKDGQYQEVYVYNQKDGLPSTEILDVLTDSNYIYVASVRGIAKIAKNPLPFTPDSLQRLSIRSFKVNDNEKLSDPKNNFLHTENNIEINYHLLDFTSKGQITYEYKLAPIQTTWLKTEARELYFADLRPNDYQLELKATDLYGKEYFLKDGFSFCIQKSIWQQLWFQVLAVGSFIGLLLFFIIKREQQQQAKLAHEKSLNDRIADLQMESLRAQMNPHFIFNALGSIQYFIQTARTDEADDFLTMFARLMRKYLDSATERVISLATETSLLEEYTRLEMMRFEGQFDTKIEVAPDMHLNQSTIPSMLIQPFVENAINHGLQPRLDKTGELRILFFKNKEDLICCITDNGIGRANAALNKRKNHKSRGMKNVHDRIETLRANELSDIRIDITDLDANHLQFPGTKVTITIKKLDHEI